MTDNKDPIVDGADLVSAFMSLPEVLQRAALMVVLAGAEVEDGGLVVSEVLRSCYPLVSHFVTTRHDQPESAEAAALLRHSVHFMDMSAHVLTALSLARTMGWKG
jgi:hypothetical protein